MLEQWAPILVFMILSLITGLGAIVGAWVLGTKAKKHSPSKRLTYECGENPQGSAWIRFHPRYYVVALVFILFDVEAVFLFPWALNLKGLGLLAVIDMTVFAAVLMLGWVYALRKGALRWQ